MNDIQHSDIKKVRFDSLLQFKFGRGTDWSSDDIKYIISEIKSWHNNCKKTGTLTDAGLDLAISDRETQGPILTYEALLQIWRIADSFFGYEDEVVQEDCRGILAIIARSIKGLDIPYLERKISDYDFNVEYYRPDDSDIPFE